MALNGRRPMRQLLALLVLLLAPASVSMPALAQQQAGPSFDCGRAASLVEKAICTDPALAEADRIMARLFAATRTSAFGTGPSNLLPGQLVWLKERKDCEAPDRRVYESREQCLSQRYRMRNQELAVAALFTDTALALATLRKTDPEMAPLYEAVFLYASRPGGDDWSSPALAKDRQRLLDLLRPQFALLQGEPMRSYGRDILKDDGIAKAEDAIESEAKFVRALPVLATYVDGEAIPMRMPCAAILRRPKLSEATFAVFGSGLDSGVPLADCGLTLPPLPKLDALVERIYANWPECQGSIRFMAYRGFSAMVTDARLGSDLDYEPANAPPLRLKGVRPAVIDAAVAELAVHYAKYRNAPPARARTGAKEAIRAILEHAYACGD